MRYLLRSGIATNTNQFLRQGFMHTNETTRIFQILATFIILILAGCVVPPVPIVTHTPTASLTPTCVPISLSTPEGWNTTSRLFVILYDPRSVGNGSLGFENRETTQDVAYFIRKIVPNLMDPGDQVAIFQLGYSSYDAAQVTRLNSYTTLPSFYNTPSPKSTLTPIPSPSATPDGYEVIKATNVARVEQTQRAKIELQNASEYNCEINYWNENVKATASIWNVTATAEIMDIHLTLENEFKRFFANSESLEIPFRTNELYYGGVYDGLEFTTTIMQPDDESGCKKYTECILIVIDDMQVWGENNPNNLSIDLRGVSVYIIMPNCRDINNNTCQKAKNYWNNEFKHFGVTTNPEYWVGNRAEINLLNAIGR